MSNLTEQSIENNQDLLIGNIVVLKNPISTTDSNEIFEIKYIYLDATIRITNGLQGKTVTKREIRLATIEELNANRRLSKQDEVEDIKYHISPNCKVIHFDSWDEALHFHRAFHAQKEIP